MADSRLQVVIDLKDQASKQLDNFNSKVQNSAASMKKIGAAFTVFGGVVSAGFGVAVKEAAKAEGSFAKFNTVFGDGADDMMKFINDIRTRMPTATTEIVRMSADLQDLLVPLGLTREKGADLTQGFVELANQLGAFNDVDPTEVLEAFKSGLSGSSEPLRRFGINALETSLEAKALEMGLLKTGESFNKLDPTVKNQIRAQALLAQSIANSSDAINGFETNNNSFIRRQQELSSKMKDLSVIIGTILLPIIDKVVKAILPLIEKIAQWADEHPKLASAIVIVTASLGALFLILGPIFILMGAMASASVALGIGFLPLIGIIAVVTLGITALIVVIAFLVKHFDTIKATAIQVWSAVSGAVVSAVTTSVSFISDKFKQALEIIKNIFTGILEVITTILNAMLAVLKFMVALMVGAILLPFTLMGVDLVAVFENMKIMVEIVWTAMTEYITSVLERISALFSAFLSFVKSGWMATWGFIKTFFSQTWAQLAEIATLGLGKIKDFVISFTQPITQAFSTVWDSVKNVTKMAFDSIGNMVRQLVNNVFEKINKLIRAVNSVASKGAGALGISIPSIPEIPLLAKGGIVDKPTLAMIGEAGPEAVIPLNKSNTPGMGGVNVNIVVQGDVSGEELVEKVGNELTKLLRLSTAVV